MAVEPILTQVRRFSDAHGEELRVGSVDWRYYRLGTGPPVVWLTGGLRRAALGFAFLEILARTHTVLAPDYPPLKSFEEFDAGLSGILRAEGMEHVDLAGQSYGGLLAQAFLARHPQAVNRLVLSSSGPGNYGRGWLPMSFLAIAAARVLPARMLTGALAGGLSRLLPPTEEHAAEWRAALRGTVEQELTRADVVSHFAVAADIIRRRLVGPDAFRGWRGRVTLLAAENDPTQARTDLPRFERLFGRPVQVVSMGEAGHAALLIEPQRYARWLETALA